MAYEYSPRGQYVGEDAPTALEIAEEQTGALWIALTSPSLPADVKDFLRQSATERRLRLEEAGEYAAAEYYNQILSSSS